MIKFFRHIRRSLLNENKMGKYFKYAIGEILLVVIGILIALSINTWNENEKNKVLEQTLLTDLKIELESNIENLEFIINEHQKSLNAAFEIKLIISDPNKFNITTNKVLDSIQDLMNNNWTYNPKLGVLNSAINSGKIDLIQNKNIKYRISSIEDFIKDANESTYRIESTRESIYWPLSSKTVELYDDNSIGLNNQKLFTNPQFLWWTKFLMLIRKEGLGQENELLNYLKDTRKLIDSEIKK